LLSVFHFAAFISLTTTGAFPTLALALDALTWVGAHPASLPEYVSVTAGVMFLAEIACAVGIALLGRMSEA
jgi:hypothetical protein